ncbi:MAG: hypothetical protein KGI68_00990 [Alphaproteobacteria bacterium]|nr:hypothetical protein [Alphaproteobacteria bacterium]MDE1985224.1 hypothetical protein [Alphaproteobacteria bacterium]MDE2162563.1 hypothetical protein [Alphaproteobacteria bacterium]MDE2264985.1 hypothetical protein [Alphaproteobacteria bacterium]MDE2500775.1 hypothetical protein [Alphaproteobacteria bacterium]
MSNPVCTADQPSSPRKITVEEIGLFLVVAIFGLLPLGLASGLMLLQILGLWSY